MQDLASELRRIPIPRTPVNKGRKEGRSYDARLFLSGCYLVNWNSALWSVPSFSLRFSSRHVPFHAFSVFQL
jgi:hypothetical protein